MDNPAHTDTALSLFFLFLLCMTIIAFTWTHSHQQRQINKLYERLVQFNQYIDNHTMRGHKHQEQIDELFRDNDSLRSAVDAFGRTSNLLSKYLLEQTKRNEQIDELDVVFNSELSKLTELVHYHGNAITTLNKLCHSHAPYSPQPIIQP